MESTVVRQVRHVLAIDPRRPEVNLALEGLQALGLRAESRGGLKASIKQTTIQLYRDFLEQYRPLVAHVNSLAETSGRIAGKLAELQGDLVAVEERTSETVRAGRTLKAEREMLRTKQTVLSEVLAKLSLTHEEVEMLTSSEEPIGPTYFATLKKLLDIKRRSDQLQACDHKLLSASIEEYLTQVQESAYEKIFRFMQAQARLLEHDTFTGYDQYATAVRYLREKPLYYEHFRAEIIRCRQVYLVRKLQEMGVEGEEGFGRMLAWVHSALVSEQQLVAAILESVESVPQATDSLQETTVLDLIADSLSRHFSLKAEQLLPHSTLKPLAKAFSLLDFSLKSLTDSNLLTYTSKLVQELFRLKGVVEERLVEAGRKRLAHVKALGLQLQDLRTPSAYLELVDDLVQVCRDLSAAEALEVHAQLSEVVLGGGLAYYDDLVVKSSGATAALVMLLNVCDYCKFKLSETEVAVGWVELLEKKATEVESELLRKGQERAKVKGEDMTMAQLSRIRETLESGDVSEFLPLDKVRNKNAAKRLQSGVVAALLESYEEGYGFQRIKPECRPGDLADQVRRLYI